MIQSQTPSHIMEFITWGEQFMTFEHCNSLTQYSKMEKVERILSGY